MMIDFEQYRPTAIAEVGEIEKAVRSYRVRMNDMLALKKAFHDELKGEKLYRYLTIEKLIKQSTGKEVRFMDWLMERRYTLQPQENPIYRLTKHLDPYFEYLKEFADVGADPQNTK